MSLGFLIVEDHPLYGEALESVLASAMADARIEFAENFEQAKLSLQRRDRFDLVFLDLALPDTRGMDGLIELRSRFPKQPIAIVSAFDDDDAMQKAAVFGAAGFIPKTSTKTSIMLAVAAILRGDTSFPNRGQRQGERPDAAVDELTSKLETLTRQQLRVLHFLCAGMLNKQIAHELSVGETTVKAHVSEILRKMNVTSRTRAVLEIAKLESRALYALLAGGCDTNAVN